MVLNDRPTCKDRHAAELILARSTRLHPKAEYIAADLSLDQTNPCSHAADQFGEERLVSCCRLLPKGASAESICAFLSQRVAEWSAGAEQFDDTTLLVLAVN